MFQKPRGYEIYTCQKMTVSQSENNYFISSTSKQRFFLFFELFKERDSLVAHILFFPTDREKHFLTSLQLLRGISVSSLPSTAHIPLMRRQWLRCLCKDATSRFQLSQSHGRQLGCHIRREATNLIRVFTNKALFSLVVVQSKRISFPFSFFFFCCQDLRNYNF